ncbi:DUF6415 family natural product biosynthesis protein [Streptomyces sp. NBC_01233]|uniref:DUF6415 family natural product biosynthesis protein n=1 Tax=Streptomyces sp. NBC_01233 TaxID=2903787 RepID=UPI002E0E8596|nr:DUF6415 family natural product biosynthesis protein [Streptomyces sp. NBC_01233]
MEATRGDLDTVAELVKRALVPYNRKPDDVDIEILAERLLEYGTLLLVEVVDLEGAAAPLSDWHMLTDVGASKGPLGQWNHVRGMARTVRRMLLLLGVDAR